MTNLEGTLLLGPMWANPFEFLHENGGNLERHEIHPRYEPHVHGYNLVWVKIIRYIGGSGWMDSYACQGPRGAFWCQAWLLDVLSTREKILSLKDWEEWKESE